MKSRVQSKTTLKRRHRIRALKIRRALFIIICTVLFAAVILGVIVCFRHLRTNFHDADSRQLEKISAAEIPDWVDVQLIGKGTSRSGEELDRVSGIVIHYVGNPATTAQNNRNYFSKSTTEVCSHFVVGLDGEIIQCVPITERAVASNNRNGDTIAIEVCHPDETGKFNGVTYDSLVKLTAWLCEICDLDENDVIRHYDITGKLCPLYFVENQDAWNGFKDDVKKELKNESK